MLPYWPDVEGAPQNTIIGGASLASALVVGYLLMYPFANNTGTVGADRLLRPFAARTFASRCPGCPRMSSSTGRRRAACSRAGAGRQATS